MKIGWAECFEFLGLGLGVEVELLEPGLEGD